MSNFIKNYRRLFSFMKGKYRFFITSMIMIVIIQVLNFISPLLVKSLLDDYIMGVEKPWVEVLEEDDYTVYYDNKYFKQERFVDVNDVIIETEDGNSNASVVLYKTGFYFVNDKVVAGNKSIVDNKLTVYDKKTDTTYTYDVVKLDRDQIFMFYEPVVYFIAFIIFLIFLRSIINIICSFVQQMCCNRVVNRIVFEERLKGMQAIERLSIKDFEQEPAGKMATRVISDVDGAITMYRQLLNLFVSVAFSFIFAYVGMFMLDVKLALITFIFYPFVFIWVKLFLKKLKVIAEKVNESRSMLTAKVNEIINGISILQLFNFKKKTIEEFNEVNNEFKNEQLKDVKLSITLGWNMLNVIRGIITAFIVAYFGWQYLSVGGIVVTAGLVYSYNEYILKLIEPVNIIFNQISSFQHSHVQTERYHKLLESNLESFDKDEIERYKGDIKFENVWFSYVDDNYVLKGINLDIKSGEMIGLVGHTGSGKSSLMNLLLRFYDLEEPSSGKIYVDGKDISIISKRTYREHIGIVLQEPVLFEGTIASNIRFGKENVSDEEIIQVLNSIGGDKIIKKFERGINQEVSRAGINMSAGEKQIISLARVLIHNPAILIMDEATSHIDLETEEMIKKALEVVRTNRTVIVIAHRLSTIFDADKIFVLDHGQVVEEGNHFDLIKKNGMYANIYHAQAAGVETIE